MGLGQGEWATEEKYLQNQKIPSTHISLLNKQQIIGVIFVYLMAMGGRMGGNLNIDLRRQETGIIFSCVPKISFLFSVKPKSAPKKHL